jgi:hypothetical protein
MYAKRMAALFRRKSSEEGLEQAFNSLNAQREACAAFILSQKHEGWTVLPALCDVDWWSAEHAMTLRRSSLVSVARRLRSALYHSDCVLYHSALQHTGSCEPACS